MITASFLISDERHQRATGFNVLKHFPFLVMEYRENKSERRDLIGRFLYSAVRTPFPL